MGGTTCWSKFIAPKGWKFGYFPDHDENYMIGIGHGFKSVWGYNMKLHSRHGFKSELGWLKLIEKKLRLLKASGARPKTHDIIK